MAISSRSDKRILQYGNNLPLVPGNLARRSVLAPRIKCQQKCRSGRHSLADAGTISASDLDLFLYVETAEQAVEAIDGWEERIGRTE